MTINDFIKKGVKIKNDLIRFRTKKIDKVDFYFDELINGKNSIFIRGWILRNNGENINPSITFVSDKQIKKYPLKLYNREDVAKSFNIDECECGFEFEAVFSSNCDSRIYLEYNVGKSIRRIVIGAFKGDIYSEELNVNVILSKFCDYNYVKKAITVDNNCIPKEIYNYTVDIIVPVYNGFEFLENLFNSIENTDMKYRLYIVNDKSPDERVMPFLVEYAKDKDNVILLENIANLGFVQSVNKAIEISSNDVVIVNTDVVVPDKWLERLMIPIIMRNDVASATPFTNSGTICSFPVFCDNNDIFLDIPLETIDNEFSKIKAIYNDMPTGVGFCMGMKRNVINKIGILNAEVFYKGYGEENDWCQRAAKNGFRNVMVENLFVWHKHGGSFLSEDKKRYIERNLKLLSQMHPEYEKDVAIYCRRDPVKNIREYVKWQLIKNNSHKNIIVFNHNWGGGAITYINDKIKSFMDDGYGVLQIINDVNYGLIAEYNFKNHRATFGFESFDNLFDEICGINCNKILINEFVSFENVKLVQDFAIKLKHHFNAELVMLGHDFYSICPSIYLMDSDDKHCFMADEEKCNSCYKNNKNFFNRKCESIVQWRKLWYEFLKNCDEILLFSYNTKSYFDCRYPKLSNIKVIPHNVDYISAVENYEKSSDIITIAVIGNLMKTKGSEIIYEMADIIKKDNINARIVVVGPDLDDCRNKDIIIHGRYKREELPSLMKKYEVDIIFIASIWPETFSYTTEEAIKMNMKVASFDIGAPAERLKKYDKGIIIDEISAEKALYKIIENVDR